VSIDASLGWSALQIAVILSFMSAGDFFIGQHTQKKARSAFVLLSRFVDVCLALSQSCEKLVQISAYL